MFDEIFLFQFDCELELSFSTTKFIDILIA